MPRNGKNISENVNQIYRALQTAVKENEKHVPKMSDCPHCKGSGTILSKIESGFVYADSNAVKRLCPALWHHGYRIAQIDTLNDPAKPDMAWYEISKITKADYEV